MSAVVKAIYNDTLKKLLLIVAFAAAGGVTWLLIERSAPLEISFVRVKRETLVSAIQTNGKIEPLRMMAARAERSGVVSRVLVERGIEVKQGAVIAELTADNSAGTLDAALARIEEAKTEIASLQHGGRQSDLVAIENSIAEAKVQLSSAERELAALKRLEAKQAATGEEVKKAERDIELRELELRSLEKKRSALVSQQDVRSAEARLRQAEAEAAQARRALSERVVRAGMSGVLYNLEVRAGGFVEQGGLIGEIGQLEKVRVVIYVDEPDLGRVSASMPVVITWDARPGREWRGSIDRLATSIVKLGTRQVGEVIGIIENTGLELVPEANVNVEIRSRVAENVLTIPKEALRHSDGNNGVYILEDDKLQWRPIQAGASNITSAEILSGLKEGDAIAATATEQLRPGMKVKPVFQ